MKKNPLTQRVNSWIGLCFVAAFGLFMTTTVLNVMHADDPIVDAAAAVEQAGN